MSAWRTCHLQAGLSTASLGTTRVIYFLRCIKGSLKWESDPDLKPIVEGSSPSRGNLEDRSKKKLCGAERSQAVKNANPAGLQRNRNAPFTLYNPMLNMGRDRAELRKPEISSNNMYIQLQSVQTAQPKDKTRCCKACISWAWWLSSPDYVRWPYMSI